MTFKKQSALKEVCRPKGWDDEYVRLNRKWEEGKEENAIEYINISVLKDSYIKSFSYF